MRDIQRAAAAERLRVEAALAPRNATAPGSTDGSALRATLVEGQTVEVTGNPRELRAMVESHVSVAWTDDLARFGGMRGRVRQVDADESAHVM